MLALNLVLIAVIVAGLVSLLALIIFGSRADEHSADGEPLPSVVAAHRSALPKRRLPAHRPGPTQSTRARRAAGAHQ
jgi:hypothetical protein